MTKLGRQWLLVITFALCVVSSIFILSVRSKLAVAAYQVPSPQAVLVLGGSSRRELSAAQLAAQFPSLDIWVSSGLPSAQSNEIFLEKNVPLSRVNFDYKATDTVTNFTTIVGKLQEREIQHIYLITSDFHMRRATAIAFWVLGSRGIAYTPVLVSSSQPPEPHHKIIRDVARSWLWLLTGRTGSSLDPNPPVRSSQYQPINAAKGCLIATQAPQS